MRRVFMVGLANAALFMSLATYAQDCLPCEKYQKWNVNAAKKKLEQAFSLSLTVPDCYGSSNLETCDKIGKLLDEVFETVDSIYVGNADQDADQCLSCDPALRLLPIANALAAMGNLMYDSGYGESALAYRTKLSLWKRYRCPCSGPDETPAPVMSDREGEARADITERCGAGFATKRRGLRQIMRVPDDRSGCYQTRACRGAMEYRGYDVEPGFWTYDGEFWYVWAERQTRTGDWVECHPE
jgi:hypothetical protein